jgi:hypothetical protein
MRYRVCTCGIHVPEQLTSCQSCGADVSARPFAKKKQKSTPKSVTPGSVVSPDRGKPALPASSYSSSTPRDANLRASNPEASTVDSASAVHSTSRETAAGFYAFGDSLEELRRRYAGLETHELFAIVHTDSDQYRPGAVRIAQEELAKRRVSSEDTAELQLKAETERRARLEYEESPLPTGLKALCLLQPGMPGLVTHAVMVSKGRKRAAREAIEWFGIGFWVWVALMFAFCF